MSERATSWSAATEPHAEVIDLRLWVSAYVAAVLEVDGTAARLTLEEAA